MEFDFKNVENWSSKIKKKRGGGWRDKRIIFETLDTIFTLFYADDQIILAEDSDDLMVRKL